MSAEETVLMNLFDSYWFEYGVFTPKPPLATVKTGAILQVQEDEEEEQEQEPSEKPKLNRITTLMRKSFSDQFLSSKDCSDSTNSPSSPKSVLVMPQLQTILSGKEVESFPDSAPRKEEEISIGILKTNSSCVYHSHTAGERANCTESEKERHKGPLMGTGQDRRKRRRSSRSLSELEFEELKGFMDLGFLFSDKDKDSRLVSIIPGLQRLGKNEEKELDKGLREVSVPRRPYLSEAWDVLEDDEKGVIKNPLVDWRIPAFGDEMELKDHLRSWAHTVASTVR
ncbi:hypothetical protein Pfo_022518 [Paulownia fortunei]|nr:hypothetical protein Pfo_022518 [Paulownia fortunei]